jgi:hypothetical protein
MASVEIPDDYLAILEDFGNIDDLAKIAIKHHVIELTTKKMEEFKDAINVMESKYGCDYKSFITLSVNKDFREQVLLKNDNWKADLLLWEKNTENLSTWVERVARLIHDLS